MTSILLCLIFLYLILMHSGYVALNLVYLLDARNRYWEFWIHSIWTIFYHSRILFQKSLRSFIDQKWVKMIFLYSKIFLYKNYRLDLLYEFFFIETNIGFINFGCLHFSRFQNRQEQSSKKFKNDYLTIEKHRKKISG